MELAAPHCQDWLIFRAFLVIFIFTAESGDGKAGIMPPCRLHNTQTPLSQSDNFLLIKARAKMLLSCHQDSWFISSSLSFHLLPRKYPVWHSPCQLIQPHWSLLPGRNHLPWQCFWHNCLCWSQILSVFQFGMETARKSLTFLRSWRILLGKLPTFHTAPLQGKATRER